MLGFCFDHRAVTIASIRKVQNLRNSSDSESEKEKAKEREEVNKKKKCVCNTLDFTSINTGSVERMSTLLVLRAGCLKFINMHRISVIVIRTHLGASSANDFDLCS